MSYILDALKKSEQERGHGAVPGVQTIHSSSVNYHQDRRPVWPWFLLTAVIINIAALFYFMQSRNVPQHPDNAQTITPAKTETPGISPTPQIARQIASRTIPAPAPAVTSAPAAPLEVARPATSRAITEEYVEPEPVLAQQSTPANTHVAELFELPLSIRQHIPQMTFSAHVYSSNALQRSLVINGRFMEEGDQVTNDLTLIEITRNGAIFDFQGQLFSTSVLSGWN